MVLMKEIINLLTSGRKKKECGGVINSAKVAKDRLQILITEGHRNAQLPYLADLKKELLEVICKYVDIGPEMISVHTDNDVSIIEVNISLPET